MPTQHRHPPRRASSTASSRGSSSTRACSTSRPTRPQPLLERVKFCSIFSSNLDEFFMVRVAGPDGPGGSGARPCARSTASRRRRRSQHREARVTELTSRQSKLWKRELRPALAAEGIEIVSIEECSAKELKRLESVFTREIYPVLTPLAVGVGQPFPYISGLSLSLGGARRRPGQRPRSGSPASRCRKGSTASSMRATRLVPLESVIAHFLPSLFPGMEIAERVLFRVTRDADFEVSDDADDLLEAVESELRRRRFGDVIRVEVSASASTGDARPAARGARRPRVTRSTRSRGCSTSPT